MVKITPIIPSTLALQTFSPEDFAIIPNTIISSQFDPVNNYIEYFVYDYNNNLLDSNSQLTNFTPVRLNDNGDGNIVEISLNPETDAVEAGYDTGIVKTVYNFVKYHLGSSPGNNFYISDISPSRTEVRLKSNNIRNFQVFDNYTPGDNIDTFREDASLFFEEFKQELLDNNQYFDEFYLNFGDNNYVLGVNALLEIDFNSQSISLLVKLYEPLPSNLGTKSETYIVTKVAESVGYQLEFEQTVVVNDTITQLAPANYNIPVKDQTGPLTTYKTYTDITSTTLSGSFSELLNNISSSSPTLTIDYTDYEDFVFFSSAKERLVNFKTKVTAISSSQAQLDLLYSGITGSNSGSSVVSSSKNILEKQIQDQITSFDGYERYLYYNSGSKSWPKTNSTKPYVLADPTSVAATNWYATQSITASNFDNQNQNNLEFIIPDFIRNDSRNENYLLYTNMIGQFFDEIWLYTKEITSKLDANSSLYQGVSKDLVGTVLESLGTKIYDSSFTLENIYSSLIGLSADGALVPTTGSEVITNYVTSSIDSSQVPTIDDLVKLSYKKIYHSLPYLLKKKGTNEGLRSLINVFGIPDTILRISEFGGKDKDNNNDWDRWEHQFNYKYSIDDSSSEYISTFWQLNPDWDNPVPQTLQFRFQTPNLDSGIAYPSQSLFSLDLSQESAIVLEYSGSGYESGSYSASIADTENQYATLKFIPNFSAGPTVSASVYLPFFDGGWWSVMLSKEGPLWTLYAGNNIYSGSDGSQIGFFESSSVTGDETIWNSATQTYFGTDGNDINFGGDLYRNFSGSYQEIRYYDQALSSSVFEDYVMNPHSIEGNSINTAPEHLAFRASLGNTLYTGSTSIHPMVTGSWDSLRQSFTSGSSFTITGGTFVSQRDYVFYDQIPAGVKNIVSNKVKQLNITLPYTGSESNTTPNTVLSNQIQVQQNVEPSSSYVDDINYLEVAFSPQNEINEDINSSIGYFNIGEYIGDPRLISSSADSYPALDELRDEYFKKYTHNYDLWDYIRLIRYYDNALFKMIEDFVPARTSLATGIVIKQHILERNKYPTPQLEYTQPEYTGSIGSTPVVSAGGQKSYRASTDYQSNPLYTFSGGPGGSVNELNQPLGYLRIVNNNAASSYTLDATGVRLLTDAYVDVYTLGANADGLTVVESVSSGTGAFRNVTDFDYKGDIEIQFRNASVPLYNAVFEVRRQSTDEVIASFSGRFPTVSAPGYHSAVIRDVLLESGEEYYLFAKSTGSTSVTVRYIIQFYQQDADLGQRTGQFYNVTNVTPVGDLIETIGSNHEFYDGEYSGSTLLVEDGELNPSNTSKEPSTVVLQYQSSGSTSTTPGEGVMYWQQTYVSSGLAFLGYGVGSIYINETDNNGLNIESALANLSPGDEVTFTVRYQYEDAFGPTGPARTRTVTQTIENISGLNLTAWRITFTQDSIETLTTPIYNMSDNLYVLSTVILNPYINVPNFAYSDENALLNNATEAEVSEIFYDLDYTQGAISPVNFDSVISESATKATVQDYNYFARRSIIPRYSGSKNTSTDYNVDNGAIDATQAYFAYFNWVGGTSPEWGNGLEDRSGVNLRFLIDGNGTIIKPVNDSQGINLGILRQNFTEDKISTLAFDDETGASAAFTNLLGDHVVFKSGKSITPIIYSQTESIASGSSGGYTTTLSFVQGDQQQSSVGDYRLTAFNQGDTIVTTGKVDYQNVTVQGAKATWTSDDTYSPQTTNPASENVTLNLTGTLKRAGNPVNKVVTVQFYKNGSAVGTSKQFDFNNQYYNSLDITYQDATATTSDTYDLRITALSGTGTLELSTDSYIQVAQTPVPSIGNATSPFFESTLNADIIRTTTGFSAFYGQKQEDIDGSGFFGIVNDFEIRPGDEIRFEGTETQAYYIKDVWAGSGGKIHLLLDRDCTASNLQWFLVRRYIDDAANIILEVDKPAGGTAPGILKPQYLSRNVELNIDNILEDLKGKRLI